MTMRPVVVACVVMLSAVSVGRIRAQQLGKNTMIIAPNIERILTISRSGVVLATVDIPKGTLVSVTFDTAENGQPANNGRFSFHGDVAIHALAASQQTSMLPHALTEAPIQLAASGVDVAIGPR